LFVKYAISFLNDIVYSLRQVLGQMSKNRPDLLFPSVVKE